MPERLYATVKPELLRWARESAGYSLERAAKRIGLRARDRLAQMEAGERRPTVPQLRKAARVYKRPLAAFFLPSPPAAPPLPHDFRTFPDHEAVAASPELLLEMRRARRRRAVALELLEELGILPAEFRLAAGLQERVDEVGARARRWIGVSLAHQQEWRGEYEPLNGWIAALESRGVLVFQTGKVPLGEMRGFSLSEDVLPVIVLNAKDRPRARVFTLLHEFVHLMLHLGGICDPLRAAENGSSHDDRVETFCNRVAGAALVPGEALLQIREVAAADRATEWEVPRLRALADRFAVSREVVLLRLLALGRTNQRFVSRTLDAFRREYAEGDAGRSKPSGPVPQYRLVLRNNGRRFTRLVLEALERERITLADVSDYLGVRLKHLDRIADALQAREAED